MRKSKTLDLVNISVCVALITICTWISIPATVPFTLQTFAIFLTGSLLGGKKGSIAAFVYLLLGAVGVPVFSMMQGGLGKLLGPTGGYLIGFLCTLLIMWLSDTLFGRKPIPIIISMLVGLIICYAFGTAWFMVVCSQKGSPYELIPALSLCVFPFIIPDLIKLALAYSLGETIKRVVPYFREY